MRASVTVRKAKGLCPLDPRQGTVVPWTPRTGLLQRGARAAGLAAILALMAMVPPSAARAQPVDLSRGGPITITATDGLEWRQDDREVIARGDARAVRQNVTVTADRLIAFYRPKNGAAAPQPAQPTAGSITDTSDTGGNEVYRVEAVGNVHIFTPTDQAWGDKAVYDIDQAVLVLTGHNLKLATPNDILTARDDLEYWSQKHMAVARGNAVVVTNDGRRLSADTIVAYTTDTSQPAATPVAAKTPGPNDDPLAASGKLQKVDMFGNVVVRTATDTAIGDRAVYVPDTGIARLVGHVRITRGQNQLDGTEAEVNMKTGISRLLPGTDAKVQGLLIPNDTTNQQLTGQPPAAPAAKPPPGAPK